MQKLPPPKKTVEDPKRDVDLAKILGISKHVIMMHRKNSPECPPGRSVYAWRAFMAAHGRIETAPEEMHLAISVEKLETLRIKKEQARDALKKARNQLLPADDVRSMLTQFLGQYIWGSFDKFIQEWPPKLAGLTSAQMRMFMTLQKNKLHDLFMKDMEKWLAERREVNGQ